MSVTRFKVPWRELQDVFGDPTHTSWPLSPSSDLELHKYLVALKDVRIHGTLNAGPFDEILSGDDNYVEPDELSRLTQFGINGYSDSGYALWIGRGDGFATHLYDPFDLSHNDFVKEDGGNLYLPLAIQCFYADGNATSWQGNTGVLNTGLTVTFYGQNVPMYDVLVPGVVMGTVTIEDAPTNAYLTWGGIRNVDTGAFTTANI